MSSLMLLLFAFILKIHTVMTRPNYIIIIIRESANHERYEHFTSGCKAIKTLSNSNKLMFKDFFFQEDLLGEGRGGRSNTFLIVILCNGRLKRCVRRIAHS